MNIAETVVFCLFDSSSRTKFLLQAKNNLQKHSPLSQVFVLWVFSINFDVNFDVSFENIQFFFLIPTLAKICLTLMEKLSHLTNTVSEFNETHMWVSCWNLSFFPKVFFEIFIFFCFFQKTVYLECLVSETCLIKYKVDAHLFF